ncbi:MAG: tRNA (guanosine(37)-N1)-methyltransferase TrmD [Chloroflexi bacterium]|nr:tRNA (guanosine(37)-N1)-methyltransferase TrmD [Chloroflexota bacterium]
MRFDILTLFPSMFSGPLTESILKRAQDAGLIELGLHNIRDYATDRHHITDDTPYGGGGGMLMKVEPIVAAVEAVRRPKSHVILLSPQGRLFNQSIAQELSTRGHLVLVCGRYEGVDERVRETVVDDEISIGDYVLTGGELAAMIVVDAVSRLVPGVLGARWGAEEDSHATGLLEHPHYTRPATFRGLPVPDILASGDHGAIATWRRHESIRRTWHRRPEMLLNVTLSQDEQWYLADLARETASTLRTHLNRSSSS